MWRVTAGTDAFYSQPALQCQQTRVQVTGPVFGHWEHLRVREETLDVCKYLELVSGPPSWTCVEDLCETVLDVYKQSHFNRPFFKFIVLSE